VIELPRELVYGDDWERKRLETETLTELIVMNWIWWVLTVFSPQRSSCWTLQQSTPQQQHRRCQRLNKHCSWVDVGLVNQLFYISLLINWSLIRKHPWLWHAFIAHLFSLSCFCSVVASIKCRQVLGYSSSSQIPGTCNSQACSCCGDLNMCVKCVCFFLNVLGSTRYFLTNYINYRDYWYHSYNYGLHQDLLSYKRTQESDSGPARTTSSTAAGWPSSIFSSLAKSAVGTEFTYISCFWFVVCLTLSFQFRLR